MISTAIRPLLLTCLAATVVSSAGCAAGSYALLHRQKLEEREQYAQLIHREYQKTGGEFSQVKLTALKESLASIDAVLPEYAEKATEEAREAAEFWWGFWLKMGMTGVVTGAAVAGGGF